MNNLFHIHIPYWLTILLLSSAIFFLWRELGSSKPANTTTVINHYDSSTVHTVSVPIPQIIEKTIQVSVPVKVDTTAILAKYYQKNVYSRTISDSNITANITDTVFNNRLVTGLFDYKWKKPVAITSIAEKEKFKLFAGIEAGANGNGLTTFSPELLILTNKDHLYSVNYNLQNKSINVGVAWKLNLNIK